MGWKAEVSNWPMKGPCGVAELRWMELDRITSHYIHHHDSILWVRQCDDDDDEDEEEEERSQIGVHFLNK